MAKRKGPVRVLRRKLHIGDQEWTYQVNSSGATVCSPDGAKTKIKIIDLIPGTTWDAIERAIWKRSGFEIKPSHVKKYIETNLLH